MSHKSDDENPPKSVDGASDNVALQGFPSTEKPVKSGAGAAAREEALADEEALTDDDPSNELSPQYLGGIKLFLVVSLLLSMFLVI